MKAVVFLAEGFEECEALIVADILRRAGINTIMASVKETLSVKSSRHIVIQADALAEDLNYHELDIIILPGGRLGTDNLRKVDLVKRQCIKFAKNKYVAAICAAPSILAQMGLLENKEATCHPDFENRMKGAILTKESVTVSGNIITGQGLGATFDFAFEIVRKLVGEDKVKQIKKAICYRS